MCVVFVSVCLYMCMFILLQFRARLAMLHKNLKGCKKEIKNISMIDSTVS